jgi:hypothetical protein
MDNFHHPIPPPASWVHTSMYNIHSRQLVYHWEEIEKKHMIRIFLFWIDTVASCWRSWEMFFPSSDSRSVSVGAELLFSKLLFSA